MNEARAQILAKIRSQLGRGPLQGPELAALKTRMSQGATPANPIPERGQLVGQARLDKFLEMALHVKAQASVLASLAEVRPALEKIWATRPEPRSIFVSQPVLSLDLDLSGYELVRGIPEPDGSLVLTTAFAAVAETGTLVVPCGIGHPHSLNILGHTHVVIVARSRLLANYEESWALWQSEQGERMPRALIWVTGPSRTGDIEQTMQLGAHGPKALHIFLINNM